MKWARTLVVAALTLTSWGCGAPRHPVEPAATQVYRAAVVTVAGDEIPFFLELPSNCNTEKAAVVNGKERIAVPCQRLASRFFLDFVVYGTRISAVVDDRGNLAGHWGHTGGGITGDRLPFVARPLARLDAGVRFARPTVDQAMSTATTGVAGIWRVEFASHGVGKAVFESAGTGVVQGTAEVPSEYGDLRFLAGNVYGSSLFLSTFDGAGGYLMRGQLAADGRMHGEFIGSGGTRDTFTAARSDDFEVVDPLQRVRVISSERRFDFAPLLNSRYAGKAVILELFGTWCSNCNDLAPLLTELYRQHHDEGLEILSVAYEISDDEIYRRERVAAYKAKHGVEWEVTIAADEPADLLAVGPAKISSISGVPVTIFLNRDRTIQAIYTGFWGPATGTTHEKAIATFQQLTKDILATSPRSQVAR